MRSLLKVLSLVAVVASVASAKADTIISAQFGMSGGAAVPFSGVEPDAVTADAAFAASNVWNNLLAAPNRKGEVTYTFSGLVSSTGSSTGAALSTTAHSAFNNGDFPDNYLFANGGLQTFSLTGLAANTAFTMVIYDFDFINGSRPAEFTVGNQTVLSANRPFSSSDINVVTMVFTGVTSADGTISGTWESTQTSGPPEVDWSGFQLDLQTPDVSTPGVTPEPGSLVLLGTGVLGVVGAVRRRLAGK